MRPVKHYKHFIFDFDGVISDSFRLAAEKFNEIRAELFPVLPEVRTKDDMAVVYAGSLKTCLNKWIGQEGTKNFFDQHSRRMQEASSKLYPFTGIIPVLNSLGERKVSIVTSSYTRAVKDILLKDPSFDQNVIFKIAGRELKQTKTEKILAILNELGLLKEEAVYVGDLESDILYCRDVPLDIISVGYGYHPLNYLKAFNPTYCVESIFELDELLKKLNLITKI